jgi:hypothetical protein
MPRLTIAGFLIAAAALLGGCATSVFNPATNVPVTKDTPADMDAPLDIAGEIGIAISAKVADAIEGARRGTPALPRSRQFVFERVK